jgi:Tfp pilus assembly protein PilO
VSWETVREKITPAVLVCIGLYTAAAVVAGAFLLPQKALVMRLEGELSQARLTESALSTTLIQLPALEAQQAQLSEAVMELAKQIPTQYDLPDVVEFLQNIAAHHGLIVERLDHSPVSRDQSSSRPWVTVRMVLKGQTELLSFIDHLQILLPTFHIRSLSLGRVDRTQLMLELDGQLNLRNSQWLFEPDWQEPDLNSNPTAPRMPVFSADALGWPAAVLSSISNGGVQVVGIIETDDTRSALVLWNGKRHWVRSGDWLDDAQVVAIDPKTVTLMLGTTELKLTMGE